MGVAENAAKQQGDNVNMKSRNFRSKVLVTKLSENSTGTEQISVVSSTGLSAGDRVVLVASGIPDVTLNIVSISGNILTLSNKVPLEYTTDASSAVAKER
jgi:hypothetical protein